MKAIKAFVHRNCIADVLQTLRDAGFDRLSFVDVKGMMEALSSKEAEYSIELAGPVITEIKLEMVCDDDKLEEVVQLIRGSAATGKAISGWIYVTEVDQAFPIEGRQVD
jgi:nitrogen regulatory protein P-II 1